MRLPITNLVFPVNWYLFSRTRHATVQTRADIPSEKQHSLLLVALNRCTTIAMQDSRLQELSSGSSARGQFFTVRTGRSAILLG